MNVTTVGLDLAKNLFHIVGLNAQGREILKKRLTRAQVLKHFAMAPCCEIAMEACAGAHYFARELKKLGHETKLIPPQYVKAYVRGQKNDYNDARAIAEAARVPGMRWVAVKTVDQQDLQALARMREGVLRSRTALVNRLRGLLAEYGILRGKGINTMRRALPELLADATPGLSERFRRLLARAYEKLTRLDAYLDTLTADLRAAAREDERAQRLQTIPGFGPIVSAVFAATLGDGRQYRNGRQAAAAVGLVPRQHSHGRQTAIARHHQARRPLPAQPAGPRRALGGKSGTTQRRPLESLDQSPARDPWAQQSHRGARQQAHAHRLGGARAPHGLSTDVSSTRYLRRVYPPTIAKAW